MSSSPTPTKKEAIFDFNEFMAEMRPRMREWRSSWQLMRENWTVMAGIIMIIFIVIVAILAPFLAPPKPFADPLNIPKDLYPPKPPFIPGHPLGTGELGADIYYGVVWGAQPPSYIIIVVLTSVRIDSSWGLYPNML